jgi:uncharacterized membrane protein
MSVTHPDGSFDSGHNHLKPALVAIIIMVVITAITLAVVGLPN